MPFYNSSACALDLMNKLMRPTTTMTYQSQHKVSALRCRDKNDGQWNIIRKAGYTDQLLGFSKIGRLPNANPTRLGDDEGIEATLIQHKAKWHDSIDHSTTELSLTEFCCTNCQCAVSKL